jgi:hypothetical protein
MQENEYKYEYEYKYKHVWWYDSIIVL